MFSNGVIFLAAIASILIVVFNGDISKLIPLYAFGVFTGFTLSQAGMVKHHLRHKVGRWRGSLAINAIGAVSTGLVALIVVVSKFTEGAWVPAALIPLMVLAFRSHRQALQAGAAARSLRRRATGRRVRRTRWWCSSAESTRACCAACNTPAR